MRSKPKTEGRPRYGSLSGVKMTGVFSFGLGTPSSIAPVIVSGGGLLASMLYFVRSYGQQTAGLTPPERLGSTFIILIGCFILLIYWIGFYPSASLFMLLFLIIFKKEKVRVGLVVTGSMVLFLQLISFAFQLALPSGRLSELF